MKKVQTTYTGNPLITPGKEYEVYNLELPKHGKHHVGTIYLDSGVEAFILIGEPVCAYLNKGNLESERGVWELIEEETE